MPVRPLHLSAVLLASSGLACGFLGDTIGEKVSEKVAEEAVEKAVEVQSGGDANVELDQGKVQVTTDKGSVSYQAGTTLPASFPSDVPLYPGATLTSSAEVNSPEGHGFMVGLKSADTPDKIGAFYKEKLAAAYASKADMNMNGQVMLYYATPDEKRTVQVAINPAEGGSDVSITVVAK